MEIGFIGLGHMGSGMAANLLLAGHEVIVYNRTQSKAQPLVEHGARLAEQIADACHGDVVITMLADDAAVESVAFGDDGIVANLRDGGIHISMSTISVALANTLNDIHEEADQRFVSAPVFGRPEAAEEAKLLIIPAGAQDVVDECLPLLEAMGRKVIWIAEEPSAANVVKLGGNFLIASVFETLGEALALVGKAGIDRTKYLDVITSLVSGEPLYSIYGDIIVEQKFEPAGFSAQLGHKDIRLALAAADGLRVSMPLAYLLNERFVDLLSHGGESLDWSAIGQLPAEEAGVMFTSSPKAGT